MIGWLIGDVADVPVGDAWLGARERIVLARLRLAKRRGDWRLGRWIAKCALRAWLAEAGSGVESAEIEILAADSGAPIAWRHGEAAPASVSIAHRDGVALAAVSSRGALLGCDLEVIEPRSPAFVADWFTGGECQLIDDAAPEERPLVANLIWSAKESGLKALSVGLRRDTRSADVRLVDDAADGWRRLTVAMQPEQTRLDGWWRTIYHDERGFVLTVVGDESTPPVPLARAATSTLA